MKKIISILVLFISGFGLAQNKVLVTLLDGNFTVNTSPPFSLFTITDSGLNQILNTYNATYDQQYMNSCSPKTMIIMNVPITENITSFTTDLNNYNAVVLDAQLIGSSPSCDACIDFLSIALVNANIGSFQSLVNGIVQTNNTELNAIFQTYNVFEYSNFNGQVTLCNCDIVDLKASLQNLDAVIANVDSMSCQLGFFLGNDKFESKIATIGPNPFSSTFEINTKEPISTYKIFDVLGKQIISTNTKQDLDSKTETLNSGVYLFQLTFDNGKSNSIKLVKR